MILARKVSSISRRLNGTTVRPTQLFRQFARAPDLIGIHPSFGSLLHMILTFRSFCEVHSLSLGYQSRASGLVQKVQKLRVYSMFTFTANTAPSGLP